VTDGDDAPSATADLAPPPWVTAACDEPPRSARRARWGFRHESWIVELPERRRVVVQRRTDGTDPTTASARTVRERVRATGLAVPEPERVRGIAGAPVVVLPWIEGVVAADLLATRDGATAAGRACGEVAARLAAVDGSGLTPPDPDASADALREALPRGSSPSWVIDAILRAVDETRARGSRFAHGDLAPVNVLVADGRAVAVLDLDRARLAHPWYDAAWFGWVVSVHHPGVAEVAWAAFGAASGLGRTPIDALAWLWPLQLSERVAEARDDAERETWSGRLAAVLRA
jgi:aminoglycoside phosphotransferase (APT) family kinase protein